MRKQCYCCLICMVPVQAPMIDNPEYEHIPDVYKLPPLKFVGFELWQARPHPVSCETRILAASLPSVERLYATEATWMSAGVRCRYDGKHGDAGNVTALVVDVGHNPACDQCQQLKSHAPRLHACAQLEGSNVPLTLRWLPDDAATC